MSLVTIPLFYWLTKIVGDKRRTIVARTQIALADMSAITQETLSVSGVLLSKVFGRQEQEGRRYRTENQRLADLELRGQMVGQSFFTTVQVFFSLTPVLIYLLAGVLLNRGSGGLSAGAVVAFTTLQTRLYFPIGQLLQVSVELRSSLALFDRIFAYLDLVPDIVDSPDARDLRNVSGRVQLADVDFAYPRTTEDESERPRLTLSGVSLDVRPGQLAALVGPSGAGKTTISYLIPRLYDVTGGAVLIDGQDVRDLTERSLSDAIGFVTQESYLFHSSIRDNLLYGKPEATQAELEQAAKDAYIHDRIMEFPAGYDTIVGERGYRLSGGEKQRLAIARVLLHDPRILILDEATSALDTESERMVQRALERLMVNRTTVAVAHRLSTIVAADVIFVIDRGRVVEQGTHDELLELDGLYAGLYRAVPRRQRREPLRRRRRPGRWDGGPRSAQFGSRGTLTRGTLIARPGRVTGGGDPMTTMGRLRLLGAAVCLALGLGVVTSATAQAAPAPVWKPAVHVTPQTCGASRVVWTHGYARGFVMCAPEGTLILNYVQGDGRKAFARVALPLQHGRKIFDVADDGKATYALFEGPHGLSLLTRQHTGRLTTHLIWRHHTRAARMVATHGRWWATWTGFLRWDLGRAHDGRPGFGATHPDEHPGDVPVALPRRREHDPGRDDLGQGAALSGGVQPVVLGAVLRRAPLVDPAVAPCVR